jgi:Na+/H+ antiporter NhaA
MMLATTLAGWLCIVALLKPRISGSAQKLFLAGLAILVIMVAIGADRGAEMVYRYATSVNLPAAAP